MWLKGRFGTRFLLSIPNGRPHEPPNGACFRFSMWQVPWSRFNQFVNMCCFPETWQRHVDAFQVEIQMIGFQSWSSSLSHFFIYFLSETSPLYCCADLHFKKVHITNPQGRESRDTSGVARHNLIRSSKDGIRVLILSLLIDRLCPTLPHSDT